ncbi:hypothetical protein SAMN05192533_101495 [Mesobacillus persicus]|uniref:Uncharacterized protein n=1 Tax=Mesobacillus persicus TaxID=930146 RepID=A0A1H7WNE7_9BACI|nr:hypothetical protein [Mesobacillus persicus]SEM22548.1 hypothetical protein SAMN05192533_101495 [Mesobacillus persicus]
MKVEKLIADELQCMFLDGKLEGFKEEYINLVTRKLRIGELALSDLIQNDPTLKDKIIEAEVRIVSYNIEGFV